VVLSQGVHDRSSCQAAGAKPASGQAGYQARAGDDLAEPPAGRACVTVGNAVGVTQLPGDVDRLTETGHRLILRRGGG
jgi:hypothetical protein